MVVNDNFLSASQNFFSQDAVQKISDVIGQTSEKTRAALKSVIPTLMTGIVDIGSTPEGAAKLVDMINTHKFETIRRPDENRIKEGHDVVQKIYGNNLNAVLSKLESTTGLGVNSIGKIMDLAAPVFMGVLGSKVKYEKSSSLGIMNFLEQQKKAISGFSANVATATASAQEKMKTFTLPKQEIPWRAVLLTALVLMGAYFWWMAANEVPVSQVVSTQTTQPISPILKATPIRDLEKFIIEGTANELPKHFKFERLRFISGEVGLARGSEPELDRVASIMKQYSAIKIRIEGFTDNVGPEERNRKLSLSRAQKVKEQIIARGIEANRIQVFGYGSANPVANNALVHGRAVNNRVELVVTEMK